jgi:hypothetical protein
LAGRRAYRRSTRVVMFAQVGGGADRCAGGGGFCAGSPSASDDPDARRLCASLRPSHSIVGAVNRRGRRRLGTSTPHMCQGVKRGLPLGRRPRPRRPPPRHLPRQRRDAIKPSSKDRFDDLMFACRTGSYQSQSVVRGIHRRIVPEERQEVVLACLRREQHALGTVLCSFIVRRCGGADGMGFAP